MHRDLNKSISSQRSHLDETYLIEKNLRTKYVTPQLYNYCMNIFFTFFESENKLMKLHYKESLFCRDYCQYLMEYNTLSMIMNKIQGTILNNVKSTPFYLIDFDHENHQIILTHVADKRKLKMIKAKPSLKGTGYETTTVERLCLKNNDKNMQDKLKQQSNGTENSIKNIEQLRQCLDIMTKKFNNVDNINNWNNVKQNKKIKKKDNDLLFKKALDRDKISIIEKKNYIQESNNIIPEIHKLNHIDTYGLKEIRKKNSKQKRCSKSKKKSSLKTNFKFHIPGNKLETLKKREDSEERKIYPLTPNPKYCSNLFTQPQEQQPQKESYNFLRSVQNVKKKNKSTKKISCQKFLRGTIRSLSPA